MSSVARFSLRMVAVTALGLLAACSQIPLKEQDAARRDRFEAYAGSAVDHFTRLGNYYSWEPIGRHELVVWTGASDAYLLTVAAPCEDLQFANRIALSSTFGTVYSRVDVVKVRGWDCPIEQIRPVDYQRMRLDMRSELRAAKAAS